MLISTKLHYSSGVCTPTQVSPVILADLTAYPDRRCGEIGLHWQCYNSSVKNVNTSSQRIHFHSILCNSAWMRDQFLILMLTIVSRSDVVDVNTAFLWEKRESLDLTQMTGWYFFWAVAPSTSLQPVMWGEKCSTRCFDACSQWRGQICLSNNWIYCPIIDQAKLHNTVG